MTVIYDKTKSEFLQDIKWLDWVKIEDLIERLIFEKLKKVTGGNEKRSWHNSLREMSDVIDTNDLPDDIRIAIEYNIPCWWKRIDFIVSWLDENQKDIAVIIELKQWENVEITDKDAIVKTWVAKAVREELHPSYQVLSYADLLNDYSEFIEDEPVNILPCAFLHNYPARDNKIDNEFYSEYIKQAPIFLQSDKRKLQEFIKKYVKYWDKKDIIYNIENGKIRPSKALADSLIWMVEWNKEFTLIDEQKAVYEEAKKLAKTATDWKKNVLIVKWWPGTGKSVVAINLLADLNKSWIVSQYVSKNASVRSVFVEKLTKKFKKTAVRNLFLWSWSFVDSKINEIWCLIVDEAHRLNEKSWLFANLWENQVKEIIHAARCSIFFIDEDQKVTLNDIWTIDEIKKWAEYFWANIVEMELASQFRCWWSDWYLAWLDNTLWIRETANISLSNINYDFQVFDSPIKLREAIIEKNNVNNKSRVVAWYCRLWPKAHQNSPEYCDIQIKDWSKNFGMSWNLGNTQTYAIDENSVNEAWCIHTVQWLEFDYVWVIIWPDFKVVNWIIETFPDKRASTDRSIHWWRLLLKNEWDKGKEKLDRIIKNTYRVLMSRWMKWCYVYCTDPETREYFKRMAK